MLGQNTCWGLKIHGGGREWVVELEIACWGSRTCAGGSGMGGGALEWVVGA